MSATQLESPPFDADEIDETLVARFARIVSRFPDRPAVRCAGTEVTYAELDRRSDAIAAHLPSGAEQVPIALLFEHGADVITALLAVLKSGHIYVALDPHYPNARNRAILDDVRAPVLLTNARNRPTALTLARPGQTVIDVDVDIDIDTASRPPVTPRHAVGGADSAVGGADFAVGGADSFACILYTSGSSGEPKGVLQSHRNVLFDTRRQHADLSTTPADRYGLLFSAAFAVSVTDIFGALLSGASVLPFDVREEGFPGLARWLAAEEITILDITVAAFRQLCAGLPDGPSFPHLRLLAPGGEPVYRTDVDLFKRHFARTCMMQNALGATETRTATQFFVTPDTEMPEPILSVGTPVEGKEVLLIDEDGSPVPAGASGEIVIRSRYLSPGYWNRPEQTRAAFRPDPHEPGVTLYRTGDLGRYDEQGRLYHLGRKDLQVKIRGYRVEVPAVETALARLPGVGQAVVAAREDHLGAQQLVAYLVTDGTASLSIKEMRTRLRAVLPEHEVPSRFTEIASLPTTINGKLDRRALPPPNPERRVSPSEIVRPATPVERTLVALFEEALAIRPVSTTDDFFDLGGHSLTVARLFLRIEETLGQVVPTSVLLTAPTPAQLARAIVRFGDGPRRRSPIQIQQSRARRPLFCVPPFLSGAMVYHGLARALGPDQPVYGLEPRGLDGRQPPDASVEAMSRRGLDEIRTIQPRGPYQVIGYSSGGLVAFDLACRMIAAGDEVSFLGLIDSAYPGPAGPYSRPALRARLGRVGREARECGGPFAVAVAYRAAVNLAPEVCRRLFRRAIGLRYERHVRVGEAVPPWMHKRHLQAVSREAGRRYTPPVYRGRLTYFRATGSASGLHRGWHDAAPSGIVVHDIPGPHSLVTDPHVAMLADRLKGCLSETP